MQKSTMIAIALVAIVGPFFRYWLFLPARLIYRWLWRVLPDGRVRRVLFKRVATDENYPTWPKLPPGA